MSVPHCCLSSRSCVKAATGGDAAGTASPEEAQRDVAEAPARAAVTPAASGWRLVVYDARERA